MSRIGTPRFSKEEIREIVDSLIEGTPLNKFSEEVHPFLLMPLSAAKNEAIVAGNSNLVKKIQSIMKNLRLGPENSSRASTPRRKIETNKQYTSRTISSEEPIELIIDEIIEGRPFNTINEDLYSQIILGLKSKKEQILENGDYRLSQQIENLIQELNGLIYKVTFSNVCSEKINNLK